MNKNIDPSELEKFNRIAARWWDKNSEFKPLHDINPYRIKFIEDHVNLEGKSVIDIGCGGGILSEGLAQRGATVTGVDMSKASIQTAKLHALDSQLDIDYQLTTAEEIAEERAGTYDVVTCLEMLEHVPDPMSVIQSCRRLLKPDGIAFFSTLNRNPKSYLFAVIGAEYVLNIIPKGTHEYKKFIRPSELTEWCRQSGLSIEGFKGLGYNPLTKVYKLTDDISVNYLAVARPVE